MRGPDERAGEHQFLTLEGTWNLTWRMAECGIHHSSPMRNSICAMQNGICINGVLYHTATTVESSLTKDYIIVFALMLDMRSTALLKSWNLSLKRCMHPAANLVNYRHYFLMFPIYKL